MLPLIKLIMQIVGVSEDIARVILGFIPVRRRLTLQPPSDPDETVPADGTYAVLVRTVQDQ